MPNTPFVPAEYFAPGEYLDEELAERGRTRAELALAMGKSIEYLDELCDGSRPILVNDAERLVVFLGGTNAETWLRLSRSYRRQP